MLKVLIVEDQVILRECLQVLLERDAEIEVAGLAGDGMEALEFCERNIPDLILMDIVMPRCNGIQGTQLIKQRFPHIKIIILTSIPDEDQIKKALEYGADGYVFKDIHNQDLIYTIKCTMRGLRVVHENVFENVVSRRKIANLNPEPEYSELPVSESPFKSVLKSNELEIINFIVKGKTNKEIADSVCLSIGRVKNIITDILKKLNTNDRTELAVFAVKNNLV